MNIIGTGSALPNKTVTNEMLAKFLDTNDEWISTRTGIKTRRVLSTETLVDLAMEASNKAIASARITPDDIDFIICSNVANNFVTPQLSTIVQGTIGTHCPCIDLNGACAGFIYALQIADSFLRTDKAKNILVLCAEEPTKFCNWKERSTSILFGDGAGAVVVNGDVDALQSIRLTANSKTDVLYYRLPMEQTPFQQDNEEYNPLVMKGKDVFKLAVTSSCQDVDIVLKEAGLNPDDISHYLMHQANLRIIKSIQEHLNQPEEKFPSNLERYGNTSSASIPILIDELSRKGKLAENEYILLSAFGAGFVTGACILQWHKIKYPHIKTEVKEARLQQAATADAMPENTFKLQSKNEDAGIEK
jgi:3-oxoacyl-[acyl-carrier-protein] synthase-3